MNASDLMVTPVIAILSTSSVKDAARILVENAISGAPVVDQNDNLVGILSDGDLLHRAETKTEKHRSWAAYFMTAPVELAEDFVKSHSRKVADVMTRKVVSVAPDASLSDIAGLMEANAIKRVPVVVDGRVVGIITRSNLVQALASAPTSVILQPPDRALRQRIMAQLRKQEWANVDALNVTVVDGVANLWGYTDSDAEKEAIRVLVENTAGVRAVNSHLARRPFDFPYDRIA